MKKLIKKLLLLIFLLIIIIAVVVGGYGYLYYKSKTSENPLSTKISKIRNQTSYVLKNDLPKNYLDAVVAVEDHRFYSHGAVDFIGILRATVVNAKNKELQEGGSTITQQVVKNLYFMEDTENLVKRKGAEVFIAFELENNYSKDEVLELYTNIIYFGNGYYGISEACHGYLNKEPKDMTLAEATMMAGIPNAPSVYAPTENKELCKQRQKKVINDMVANGYITKEQAENIDNSFIDEI